MNPYDHLSNVGSSTAAMVASALSAFFPAVDFTPRKGPKRRRSTPKSERRAKDAKRAERKMERQRRKAGRR